MHLTTLATTAILAALSPAIRAAPIAQGGNGGDAFTGAGGNAGGGSITFGSGPWADDYAGTASAESYNEPSTLRSVGNVGNLFGLDILDGIAGGGAGDLLSGGGLLDLDILDGLTGDGLTSNLLSLDLLGSVLGQDHHDCQPCQSESNAYGASYPQNTETYSENGGDGGDAQGGNGGTNVVVYSEVAASEAANTETNDTDNWGESEQPDYTEEAAVAEPVPEATYTETEAEVAEPEVQEPTSEQAVQETAAPQVNEVDTSCQGGNGGNAYSGAGGNAAGGNVIHNGNGGLTLIKLFSDNAGNGGYAGSGDAGGGSGGGSLCA